MQLRNQRQSRCAQGKNGSVISSDARAACEFFTQLQIAKVALAGAQEALASVCDGVIIADCDGRVTYVNRVAESLTGWSYEEALGQRLQAVFRVINRVDGSAVTNPANRALLENQWGTLGASLLLQARGGVEIAIEESAAPVLDEQNRQVGVVIVFHDARQSKLRRLQMEHLAQHDYLTGLPNRLLLIERLTQALGLAARHGRPLALLFIDLDGFKSVNDSLGHQFGDVVLQNVAKAMQAAVRESDTVCRSGGDEFLVLLTEIEGGADAARVANKLLHSLRTIDLTDIPPAFSIAASIGIAIFPDDGTSVGQLIQRADAAMYRAKNRGGNDYLFFGKSYDNRPGVAHSENGSGSAATEAQDQPRGELR